MSFHRDLSEDLRSDKKVYCNRPLLAVLSHGGMGLMMPTC